MLHNSMADVATPPATPQQLQFPSLGNSNLPSNQGGPVTFPHEMPAGMEPPQLWTPQFPNIGAGGNPFMPQTNQNQFQLPAPSAAGTAVAQAGGGRPTLNYTGNDIMAMRNQGTPDKAIFTSLYKQDPGFRSAVDKFTTGLTFKPNPVEQQQLPTTLLNGYYLQKFGDENKTDTHQKLVATIDAATQADQTPPEESPKNVFPEDTSDWLGNAAAWIGNTGVNAVRDVGTFFGDVVHHPLETAGMIVSFPVQVVGALARVVSHQIDKLSPGFEEKALNDTAITSQMEGWGTPLYEYYGKLFGALDRGNLVKTATDIAGQTHDHPVFTALALAPLFDFGGSVLEDVGSAVKGEGGGLAALPRRAVGATIEKTGTTMQAAGGLIDRPIKAGTELAGKAVSAVTPTAFTKMVDSWRKATVSSALGKPADDPMVALGVKEWMAGKLNLDDADKWVAENLKRTGKARENVYTERTPFRGKVSTTGLDSNNYLRTDTPLPLNVRNSFTSEFAKGGDPNPFSTRAGVRTYDDAIKVAKKLGATDEKISAFQTKLVDKGGVPYVGTSKMARGLPEKEVTDIVNDTYNKARQDPKLFAKMEGWLDPFMSEKLALQMRTLKDIPMKEKIAANPRELLDLATEMNKDAQTKPGVQPTEYQALLQEFQGELRRIANEGAPKEVAANMKEYANFKGVQKTAETSAKERRMGSKPGSFGIMMMLMHPFGVVQLAQGATRFFGYNMLQHLTSSPEVMMKATTLGSLPLRLLRIIGADSGPALNAIHQDMKALFPTYKPSDWQMPANP